MAMRGACSGKAITLLPRSDAAQQYACAMFYDSQPDPVARTCLLCAQRAVMTFFYYARVAESRARAARYEMPLE